MRKVACWLTCIAVIPALLAILNVIPAVRLFFFNNVRLLLWPLETFWRASTLLLFFAIALLLSEIAKPKA